VDVVLPILHGPFGEDGTVQGLLELADVPYIGAGVAASALAMDKDLFKKVMRDSGIPVAAHHAIRLGDAVENPFGYPVFVKPARLGSSVGITKVHDEEELAPAVELAFRHDEKVLVEEFVAGTEVEVGVLGNRVPPPDRLAARPDRHARARVVRLRVEVRRGRHGAHRPAAGPLRGDDRAAAAASRRLVRRRPSARAWRASTSSCASPTARSSSTSSTRCPGFTATSVWARLFEASGLGYAEALDRLIELALERHERRSKLVY
jgi:D-alanine-D-alanine ligase